MTFSIVARCKETGMLGVAASTARPAVGSLVLHAEAKVGAIATQAAVNPYFGIHGLQYLKEGYSPEEVLRKIRCEDEQDESRQVTILDYNGNIAGYTGDDTVSWAGHTFGDDFALAGNMLLGEKVIEAMKQTYEESKESYLPLKLIEALEAGQAAGGDKRGRQSAALKVVHEAPYALVDLRVDENRNPVAELKRVYNEASKNLFPYIQTLPLYK